MKQLFMIDMHNYQDCTKVFECYHSRAVICVDGQYAMQISSIGEYRFPGGRLEEGESPRQALIREVKEETGLLVCPDSIQEIGEVVELRKDPFASDTKYICHNYYYKCKVKEETGDPCLSEKEKRMGLRLTWGSITDMIQKNRNLNLPEERIRDTLFMERIINN
ncbi:MAG: NUDIX domain-containing protein [Clostridia bacterium]|nr:NUDIX domain-containing protein [Clostridia bacterium]